MLIDTKVQYTSGRRAIRDETAEVLNRVQIAEDVSVDVVILWRVQQVLREHFARMLPSNVLTAFQKNIELALFVQDYGRRALRWIDMDRFLDQSIILYLRFNNLH